ncbi:multidrug efflux SMR transporter [Oceanobacillus sp. J11TS1]|uniref:DMT family transporter n=1 Tax=Oceanobacillus sp. J11TS1 TaxID=2807191 RepID=UPI001B1E2858|nr:multidrug efflux SMR transporter [Oceanobacillus sp. J11TS1]GIO24437.1 multidrug SMR transporter [Oceanobacillus sp. J11TS1]
MASHWIYVILAGIIEIIWVTGLNYSTTILQYTGTGIAIIFSFIVLIKATQYLPVGTVYAVFAGIGAVGTVLVDSIIFGAPFKLTKIIFIALIILGVIGLKLLGDRPERGEAS